MQTVLKWKSRDYERMEIWATTSAAAADWRSTLFENCVKEIKFRVNLRDGRFQQPT